MAAVSFSAFPFPQTDHVGATRSGLSLQCPRPRMLKDFLHENFGSSGFNSFPRMLIGSFEKLQQNGKFDRRRPTLIRRLTSKAKMASSKALAIHAVVAAMKKISFPSVKARTLLPRSLSRRLSRKSRKDERESEVDFTVKVKDIIRWRSFRDLVDEVAPPLDFADSPDRYTVAATTTTTTTTSSKSSSWCESDFTADSPLPSWSSFSDDDGEVGKKYFPCAGEDSPEVTATHSEDDKKVEALLRHDEEEEEERRLEERAQRLLEDAEATISFSESYRVTGYCLDRLLLEVFQGKLLNSRESETDERRTRNDEKTRTAKVEEDEDDYKEYLLEKGKEACVREMEREGKWTVFVDEERVELGLEIEGEILGCLVDDLLIDISSHFK